MADVALTHIQLKRKLQLPSRTPLILDVFSHLVVCFTTKRYWMVLHGMLLEYLFLGGVIEEMGH